MLQKDKWKEDLLQSLFEKSIPTTKFVDDKEYLIWGFPFFNKEYRMEDFEKKFEKLVEM